MSDAAQLLGQRIRKIMINTDIDAAQHVRHSSILRKEDKEDNDQHRHRHSSTLQTAQHSGQRIRKIMINTDIDAAQHFRQLNAQDRG
jgi:hypothetical protein